MESSWLNPSVNFVYEFTEWRAVDSILRDRILYLQKSGDRYLKDLWRRIIHRLCCSVYIFVSRNIFREISCKYLRYCLETALCCPLLLKYLQNPLRPIFVTDTKDDPSRKAIGMIAEMRPPLLHSRFKQIDSEGYSFVTGLEGFKEWRIYRYLQIFTDIYRYLQIFTE
jgi:hypothetical protein